MGRSEIAASKNRRRKPMKAKFSTLVFVLTLSVMIVSGCGPAATTDPAIGMANPASVYCEGRGYTLEMRTDADGGQYGVCIFADGSECGEWAFYRGECGPTGSDVEQPVEAPTVAPTETATVQPTETPAPVEPSETWVYVDLAADMAGTTVTWMDDLGNVAASVPAPGEQYRVVGEWVYYYEGFGGTVRRVNRAGQDERFDFMNIPEDYFEGVEWVISPDGTRIVWNLFSFEAEQSGRVTLTSDLYIATIATGEARLLTTYIVHEHHTLAPWGFSPDGSQVFVYQQPYGIGALFPVYGEFSMLDVATGQLTPLPDPMATQAKTTPALGSGGGAAALSDDGARLARLPYISTEGKGSPLSLTDLASGQTTEITTSISTDLGTVRVGDGVFSPDGSTLVYTVAYGDPGSETFALIQMDLTTGTQREIVPPQPTRYKVTRFEDDGSLLLTIVWPGEGRDTWRLHPDGTMERFSELTLLGVWE
jgi:putative hemolysin